MTTEVDWEGHYKNATEQLPWDIGTPAPELIAAFGELKLDGVATLEIGCGAGTNAIWMAEQGCDVTATDISPTAIETAKAKAQKADVEVDFLLKDILTENAVKAASVDFAFDRGVFHVMSPEQRVAFAQKVAESLKDGGYWLCMAGSKDEDRENPDVGPPQLSATEILSATEKCFEIYRLNRSDFVLPNGSKHLAWIILMRKR